MKKNLVRAEKKILDQIQKLFSRNPSVSKFSRDVTVGKMNADFYVQSPTGTTSVLQVKNWEPTAENRARARDLASLYKSLSRTDNAYVIIPGLAKNDPKNGVVSPDYIYELPEQLLLETKRKKTRPPKVRKAPDQIVFAAMPFTGNYDDTFEVAVQIACLDLGYKAVRVDHQQFIGDIVSQIKKLIKESVAVIGDLSESRPNVMYEIGYAEAAGRKVIQICSTPLEGIPFDLRNNRTIYYEKGQTMKLRQILKKELKEILPETKD
jgi:hypothetical protein